MNDTHELKLYIYDLLDTYLDYFINPSGDLFSSSSSSPVDKHLVTITVFVRSVTVSHDAIFIEYPNGCATLIKVPSYAYHRLELL